MNIRVLIADDHLVVQDGLKSVLEQEPDMTVVAQATTGYEAVALAGSAAPHVVVMDISLPDLNGIEATRQILKAHPHIKVVGLSAHTSPTFVDGMLQAGASAYVVKQSGAAELLRAIRLAMEGKTYLSPEVAGGIVDEHVRASPSVPHGAATARLTSREREMLQLLAEGNTAKEMADRLHVSVKTIETHRRNVMQKLHRHTVAELTKYAIREGMTSVDF